MDVELSHLRYFVVLAEELHFGRAAARLHMAQPPLTRQIRLLEERVGCRLFERTSRSTQLTAAGSQLLERARAILADAGHAFEAARRAGSGEEGLLRLATAPSLMLGTLPQVIRAFRRKYPKVELRLNETASSAILEAVETGAADLGMIRGISKQPGLQVHLRSREAMVAILPRDHALAKEKQITASRLRGEPFVFFPRHVGPSFHDEVTGFFTRSGFAPQVTQEARQWSSIISLVSAGMGVSAGPASLRELLPRAASFVPLKGFETTVELVGRKCTPEPAVRNFIALAGK